MTVVRTRRALLVVIMLAGLLRGMYWIAAYKVPYGDETAHLAYIESLATGHGIPVTDRDPVQPGLMLQYKKSAATDFPVVPLPPVADTKLWSLSADQYQGYQAPAYHLLMVPFWWVGHALGGDDGVLYFLRLISLLLNLATVPLLYLLGKELRPRQPAVWLLAPLLFTVFQITVAEAALVDNDSLVSPAAALCLLTLVRLRRGLTTRRAAGFGAALTLVLVAKGTGVALLPLVAGGLIWVLAGARPSRAVFARAAAAAAAPVVVVLGAWTVWNLHAYHAVTGSKAEAAVIADAVGNSPGGWAGVHRLLRQAAESLFVAQDNYTREEAYRNLWVSVVVISVVGGCIAAVVRGRRPAAAALGGTALAVLVGWLLLTVLDIAQLGGQALSTGRHLDVLLPALTLAMSVGAVELLGRRSGVAVLLVVCTAGAVLEISPLAAWIRWAYTGGTLAGAAPVVEQGWADSADVGSGVSFVSRCPAVAVGAVLLGGDPPSATINGVATSKPTTVGIWTVYRPQRPVAGPIVLRLGRAVGIADAAPSSATLSPRPVLLDGAARVPAVEAFCDVSNVEATRFGETYAPQHPWPMSLRAMSDWPVLSAVIVGIECLALAAWSAGPGAADRDPESPERLRPRSRHAASLG